MGPCITDASECGSQNSGVAILGGCSGVLLILLRQAVSSSMRGTGRGTVAGGYGVSSLATGGGVGGQSPSSNSSFTATLIRGTGTGGLTCGAGGERLLAVASPGSAGGIYAGNGVTGSDLRKGDEKAGICSAVYLH